MEKQSFSKFWIIIAAGFLLVGVIWLAWFLTLQATERDVLESYNQQQLLLVEGTAVGIEGLFDDLSGSLGALREVAEIQYFDEDIARSELARKLDELSPLGITDIGFLDAEGTAQIFVIDTAAEGIDYAWRSYFKEAKESHVDNTELIIVELQTFRAGKLGFKITIPVFESIVDEEHPAPSGEFAGVIVGNLTFDTLIERHIAPFKPQGEGHIFLVNEDYDIIWSSSDEMSQANLLASRQRALEMMADGMDAWDRGNLRGDFYIYEDETGWDTLELIAFAPISIGGEVMAVGLRAPEDIVRQTSLSNFQGQQVVFGISILTILIGVLVGGFVMRRETQRRFLVEEALSQSEKEQAIVTERNRLAADLHDSVTQGLYGIMLHADAAKGLLAKGKKDKATEYLEEIKAAGKEGLAEMRLLIFELRPPVLEAEGLAAALETRLYAVEKRAGLKAEIQPEIKGRLPLEIEDGLYRISQEVLNNALKHAEAKHIWVNISQDEDIVRLEIKDDGRGFDLDTARKSGGMGLSGIEERAQKMKGKLSIETKPEQGTRTIVEVKI
ncbi:MAG: hypothetical protein GY755_05895 [Chloroflexi bacterium]|nr:hypothetical protein [Chloroflexota bacterium]